MTGPIEGSTVRLEPVGPSHLEWIQRWYEDPDLVAPYDRYEAEGFDELRRSVAAAPADPRSLAPRFVVIRRADAAPVGCVGHYLAHPVLEYVDVWYVLGDRNARGHGIGSEAVGLLIGHLFETTSTNRVGATCDVENAPSVRLLEKLGLRREGTVRGALYHHAAWHDVHLYGVTRREWLDRRTATKAA